MNDTEEWNHNNVNECFVQRSDVFALYRCEQLLLQLSITVMVNFVLVPQ